MSYILEALKRSDQDRKENDIPTVQSQPNTLVLSSSLPFFAVRKNFLLWLPLLLVALLLIWTLSKSTNSDNQSTSIAATADNSDSFLPANVTATVKDEIAQEQLSIDDSFLDELKDVQVVVAPVNDAEVSVSQASALEPRAEENSDLLFATTGQRDIGAESPGNSAQSVPEAREPVTPADPSESGSDPYEGIPHQRQLAYDLQSALPDLKVSVHVYSPTPSSRLTRIDNTIYREGDLINNELKLEEITQDGLIMSIRNKRFWRHAR